jgi:hypothetical protein
MVPIFLEKHCLFDSVKVVTTFDLESNDEF